MNKPMSQKAVAPNLVFDKVDGEQLLKNLSHFGRLLRRLGFVTGVDKTLNAARALSLVGFDSKADVFSALSAVYVDNAWQVAPFQQAFRFFWRRLGEQPPKNFGGDKSVKSFSRRLGEAAGIPAQKGKHSAAAVAGLTSSYCEKLQDKDFEQMSESEWKSAAGILKKLSAQLPPNISRRHRIYAVGQTDMRRTIRAALAAGGKAARIFYRRRREKPANIIVLADISGSMSVYMRMFVHFIAALCASPATHAFLFGTRLSPLPRRLDKDLDDAVSAIAQSAPDWEGGTRIGAALQLFNRNWLRRLPCANAVVLLATDGLERGDGACLESELRRLSLSCRRLIWLNPLLRYDNYEALAGGAKILSRNTDETRSIHNIRSIVALATMLEAKP